MEERRNTEFRLRYLETIIDDSLTTVTRNKCLQML